MRIKQTNCKPKGGLQRAIFPTGFKERYKHYGSRLKLKIGKFPTRNQVPSNGEEEPTIWSDLIPSVSSSPEVSAFVDRLNEKCSVPVDTPPCSLEHPTIGETLAILKEMEAKDSAPSSPPPASHTPPRSPFEEGMTEEQPVQDLSPMVIAPVGGTLTPSVDKTPRSTSTSPATMTSETVSEANTPPVTGRPRFPTAPQKCPRKEYRHASPPPQHRRKPLQPPWLLTALQEICQLQTAYKDILPFAPFARLIRELPQDLVEMRFTREAIQAFRSGAETYLLEIFEKANLAYMHGGPCTLQPKDIRIVRCILDHDTTLGCNPEASQAWKMDILKYRAKRITYKQAKTKEATHHAKLRRIAQVHRDGYRRYLQAVQ